MTAIHVIRVFSLLRGRVAGVLWAAFAVVAAATLQATAATYWERPEPPGPSNRRSGLAISEIHYHPPASPGGGNLEFIEIYNSDAFPADVGGYRISGDADYVIPAGTVIGARGYLVIAAVPGDVAQHYSIGAVLGPMASATNSLPDGGGVIRLRNRSDAVLVEVTYSDDPPWPVAADGAGHSLVLVRPSWSERNPMGWGASRTIGGSPGGPEPPASDAMDKLVINEFLAHTDEPLLDYIELFNAGPVELDLGGSVLTDDPQANRFVVPAGTSIPAGGFRVFDQTELGFALSALGETLYLRAPGTGRVVDAVRFGGQENGVATGRWPDGDREFRRLRTRTPGVANALPGIHDVVINEILYHPLGGDADGEFVELHNLGSGTIGLGGWTLEGGVRFTFPTHAVLPPGGFVVVARNAARLLTNYVQLNPANTFGGFSGELSDRGERLVLTMPDAVRTTNTTNGQVTTNVIQIEVDEVTYGTGGQWGSWSDGGGSSLELVDARADHRRASNWAESDESGKAPWTAFEATGVLDNGNTGYPINNLQLVLTDAGECLIDDVEVFLPGSTNRVLNGAFEAGIAGWTGQGTHASISAEPAGAGGSLGSLRLRTTGDGDTGANRLRTPFGTAFIANQTITIRAKARWLRGSPAILFRVHGNHFELPGRMIVPPDPGTPGLPNSRARSNTPPALFEVTHDPPLPAAGESIVVTARVDDSDGLASVALMYRRDPDPSLRVVSMNDGGLDGDVRSGDGLYTASLPGQTNGTLLAFYVEAIDGSAGALASRFPAGAPARECLVRVGEPAAPAGFGSYRFWMTRATFDRWRTRVKLSNDPLDVTFVYGDSRVIYSVGAMYGGSPYHAPGYTGPTGSPCDYKLVFPDDEVLLGDDEVLLSWPGNGGDDATGQREQAAYWLAEELGLPANRRRFITVYVNGVRRAPVMDDTQRANRDVIEQWYPGASDGELFKIAGWFEFDDSASGFNTVWATLQNFLTTDLSTGQRVKDVGRYRWNWQRRDLQHEGAEFGSLFNLVDAVGTTGSSYVEQMKRVVDVDQWLRTFALEHLVGNWDSYGNRNGQNMFAYKPAGDRWRLLIWDLDIALGGISDSPTSSLFAVQDQAMGRFLATPEFRRAYWRILKEAVNGPMMASRFNAMVDSKQAALIGAGISVGSPSSIKSYVASRRNYVLSQLNSVASPFAVTSNGGAAFSTNQNLVTITGTAPVDVATLRINGVAVEPVWTSVTGWSLGYPLHDGLNRLIIEGLDGAGNPVAGGTAFLEVTFTGIAELPGDHLVINEIMYHPAQSGAGFVEVLNTSARTAFDLTGWRLEGVGFEFPPGSIIAPGGFLVVANDLEAFAAAYGRMISVVGSFTGQLSNQAETLRLVRPGSAEPGELVADEVAYHSVAPWPGLADGFGASLQRLDPSQDGRHAGNWSAVDTNLFPGVPAATPGASNSFARLVPGLVPIWLNEVEPVNRAGRVDSAGEREPWVELFNAGSTALDLAQCTLSDDPSDPGRWRFPEGMALGPGEFLVVTLDGEEAESVVGDRHSGFRLAASPGVITLSRWVNGEPLLLDALRFGTVPADGSWGCFPDGQATRRQILTVPTPGGANLLGGGVSPVLINEWMAANTATIADPADGAFSDWFELYNRGSLPVDLSGFLLSDSPTNMSVPAIPPGTVVAPGGYLLVWADRDLGQNLPGRPDLHVDFRLDRSGDQIVLMSAAGEILDAVAFGSQADDVTEGRWPDGAAEFFVLSVPTPGGANVRTVEPPAALRITEAGLAPGGFFILAWDSETNGVYRVERSEVPGFGAWEPVPGEVFSYGVWTSKADPDPVVGGARYYRVRRWP